MCMKFAWLLRASSQAAISKASCSDPTGLLEKNLLLRCHSVSDESVTREGSVAIVDISEEGVYVVTAVVVSAVMVAAVVVAEEGVAAAVVAAVVELRFVAAVM